MASRSSLENPIMSAAARGYYLSQVFALSPWPLPPLLRGLSSCRFALLTALAGRIQIRSRGVRPSRDNSRKHLRILAQ